MLIKTLAVTLLLGATLLAPRAALEDGPDKAEYMIDSGHSSVLFRITHLNVSAFWGRFDMVEGLVNFDPDDAKKCSVTISIPVESINSNNQGRDDHLKGPDFFNAAEFPELTFKSTQVKAGKKGALAVTGDFSMLGETQTISFDAKPIGHGDQGRFGYRAGWEAEFTLSRSAFGMEFMDGQLGDDVRVIVALETVKR